jgi:DNA-binding transcriptional MocR family regulator
MARRERHTRSARRQNCVIAKKPVALLCILMKTGSSDERVTQHLKALAAAAPPGARLPSVRALMRELGVSPVTVQHALDRLAREGLIEARPGLGTFVARGKEEAAPARADYAWQSAALGPARFSLRGLAGMMSTPPSGALQLNKGYLPGSLQAGALLTAAAARALRRPGIWDPMPVDGLTELRDWFAAGTSGAFQPRDVIICPGTQAAIAAAFRALAAHGDPILFESPSYTGAMACAEAAGLHIVPVPADTDGVRPDLLEDAFRRTGARLFYGQPNHANPTGATLPEERRRAVLDILVHYGALMIEDDWAHDFHLDTPAPVPPLAAQDPHGHIIYVRSLTKCAAPSLRVGAICARGPAFERLHNARLADDFFVPGPLQETAIQLVTAPSWPRHLKALRAALRERRDALAAAVIRYFGPTALPPELPGGLHLWVRLPNGVSDETLAQKAASAGILISAGSHWFPAEPPAPYVRLGFANIDPEQAGQALAGLARLASGI